MKLRYIMVLILSIFTFSINTSAAEPISPDETFLFCQRDTCDLFMDVYNPAKGSQTSIDGKQKPTILFMFGGGFAMGERYNKLYAGWFKALSNNGFRVISIDYRLGLKGVKKVGIAQVNLLDEAIHLAMEDLFSATNFIIENADEMGVDATNIVISGCSAGAITAMQAEYEICNNMPSTSVLPAGFRYAGVMSFAGAILSRHGELKYTKTPVPTLMLHGTKDSMVPYNQIKFLKDGFFGSGKIVKRFQKFGYEYNMYHFNGADHEIAAAFMATLDLQLNFLNNNIVLNKPRIIEAWVTDVSIMQDFVE